MNKRGAKKILDSVLIIVLIASMLYVVFGDILFYAQLDLVNVTSPANNTVFTNASNNNINLTCLAIANTTAIGIHNLSLVISNDSNLLNNPGATNRWGFVNQTNVSAVVNNTNYSFYVNLSNNGVDDGNWTWTCYGISTNVSRFSGNATLNNGTGNFSAINRTFILDTLTPSITLNISNGSALNGTAGTNNGRNISLNCTSSTQSTYTIRNVSLWMNGTGQPTWNRNLTQSVVTNASIVNFVVNNTRDGNYIWTCDTEDSSPGNNVSVAANRTVIVDATVPSNITINSPVNNTNLSTGTLNLNWSAVDNVYTYTTCSVTVDGTVNGTGIVVQNGTSNNGSRQITGLSNADHTVNVTCNDGNSNSNTSATFKISVDAGGPTLSISPSSNTALSLGQSQSVSCSASSVTSITSLSLSVAGTNVCSGLNSCSGTYQAGTSGDKTMTCTSTNSAGVSASKSITFTVSTDSGTPTSPPISTIGGGGGGGVSTTQFDIDFTKVSEDRIVEEEGSIVSFTLDGSIKHEIRFTKIEAAGARLTIASTPKIIDIKIGQQVNVDSDDNGIYDLAVTLNGISTSGFADVIVKKISAMVPTSVTSGVSEPKEVPIVPAEQIPPSEEVTPPVTQVAKPKTSLWMLLGLIVIIAIVGVVFYFTQRGKVGSNKKYRP